MRIRKLKLRIKMAELLFFLAKKKQTLSSLLSQITEKNLHKEEDYNKKTGFAICCPVTSNIKGYPFEVMVEGNKINGAILSDHLKNLDWKTREDKFIEKATSAVLKEVISKIY